MTTKHTNILAILSNFTKVLSCGSGFLLFGILCMLGNVVFMSVVITKTYENVKIRTFIRNFVRYMWKFFINYLKFIKFIKYDFEGLENIKTSSNLIIANHPSLLDIVFLISHIKNANCIAKEALRKNIFLYPAIKASGYILNTQNEEFLQKGVDALKNGESLIIFPEGTRTKEKIIFHKGASYMGLKGAKYITPIIIDMNPRSLKKDQAWYNTPSVTLNYHFKVCEAIESKKLLQNRALPAVARELNTNLMKLYEKELNNERS